MKRQRRIHIEHRSNNFERHWSQVRLVKKLTISDEHLVELIYKTTKLPFTKLNIAPTLAFKLRKMQFNLIGIIILKASFVQMSLPKVNRLTKSQREAKNMSTLKSSQHEILHSILTISLFPCLPSQLPIKKCRHKYTNPPIHGHISNWLWQTKFQAKC